MYYILRQRPNDFVQETIIYDNKYLADFFNCWQDMVRLRW